MARVFLSYAREDVKRARTIATALEKAGHSVWWDRHLVGGSEYSAAIASALSESDAVVVLWSRAAVDSPWVRDEAAAGRDAGRLVPLSLDGTDPPLGFRQFHSIDLSGSTSRARAKNLGLLLAALTSRETGAGETAAPAPTGGGVTGIGWKPVALALGLVAALIASWMLLSTGRARSDPPTVAVLPFVDLSPARDRAYFAEGIAEEIRSLLGREAGLNVLGRSTSLRVQDEPGLGKSLGVTHLLEGSSRTSGDELRLSVRLLDASNGTELWSEDYQRRLDNVLAVQDEIGRAVAEQLKINLARRLGREAGQITSPANYALYLQARSKFRERKEGPMSEAFALARRLVEADPDYAPGHALLAETIAMLSYDNYGKLPPHRTRAAALPHARKAVELAPSSAEGYAALGFVLGEKPDLAVEPLAKAVQLDPARAELRLWLALTLSQLGRNAEALEQFRALAEMEPLWQPAIALYAISLAAAGQSQQAHGLIDGFQKRGGNPGEAVILRGRLAELRGDFSEAVRHVEDARRLDPRLGYTAQLLGWYFHILGLDRRAADMAQAEPVFTRLALSNNQSELLAMVASAGPAALDQPDSDVAVAAAADARRFDLLAKMYDHWRTQAFAGCMDLSGGGISAARRRSAMLPFQFAAALSKTGRQPEADALLRCLEGQLDRQSGGPIRYFGLSDATRHFSYAQLHALRGDEPAAFESLDRAIASGWRGWYRPSLRAYPALDPLHSDPRFKRLESRIEAAIAKDRLEVGAAL